MDLKIRSRWTKLGELISHGFRSIGSRRRLEELEPQSAVARAILAVARDDFAAHERAVFAEIDEVRQRLYARRETFLWEIEGAVDPSAFSPERQVVGDRARASSVKPHWGAFLYAITRAVKPAVCIELGSCFGVSGLYIQAGLREAGGGRLVTFEGCRAMAEIACENYRSLGMEAFTSVVGDFDRQLAPAVETLHAVDLAFVDGNHRLEPTVR